LIIKDGLVDANAEFDMSTVGGHNQWVEVLGMASGGVGEGASVEYSDGSEQGMRFANAESVRFPYNSYFAVRPNQGGSTGYRSAGGQGLVNLGGFGNTPGKG